jgi:UDP-N-acetyl-D-mannosaminuronic acid dehydrogenase
VQNQQLFHVLCANAVVSAGNAKELVPFGRNSLIPPRGTRPIGVSDLRLFDLDPEEIPKRISNGDVTIAVVGLGHVGLPLAVLLASKGSLVIGCELEGEYLNKLRKGVSPIVEHSSSRLGERVLDATCPTCGVRILHGGGDDFCPNCMKIAELKGAEVRLTGRSHRIVSADSGNEMASLLSESLATGRLSLASDVSEAVSRSDVVIVCVGTPIDARKRPDLSALISAGNGIGKGLQKGTIVILKSTVSPGTTENVFAPILERESGLKRGADFGLAHVPETTLEGLALLGNRTLPKAVGGIDRRSSDLAAAVFKVFDVPVYTFRSPKVTEAAKLFQNIYRDVNVALANELALATEALGLDITDVLEAARTEPKTHLLNPGPGVGGYCLPKDTYYLTSVAEPSGFRPRMLSIARDINESMPEHVVSLVKDACKEARLTVEGSVVAALGLSFKGNTADTRDSPSIPVIRRLAGLGMKVVVHDPLANPGAAVLGLSGVTFTTSLESALRKATVLVLLTDHLEYRAMTGNALSNLATKLKVVVDSRHIFDPTEMAGLNYTYRGVGRAGVKRRVRRP